MVVKVIISIIVICLVNLVCCEVSMSGVTDEEMEIEKQLEVLNKPPIKSFRGVSGEIFDCIDINRQPALEHPILKNHKVQMEPILLPQGAMWKSSSQTKRTYLPFVDCPKGTVPIRRTRKEDLIRAREFKKILSNNLAPGLSRAFSGANAEDLGKLYGAKGWMNIINPTVEKDQSVYSIISLDSDTSYASNYNTIQAGWTVSPELYGDTKTRFTTYWQSSIDQNSTGCPNDFCPGFVHVDQNFPLNSVFPDVSSYDGEAFELQVSIVQDKSNKNWWLTIPDASIKIGYWPSSIVPRLADGANYVFWGGLSKTVTGGKSPPLGFGKFPDEKLNHSGYFKECKVYNKDGLESVPSITSPYVDNDINCYKLVNIVENPHAFVYGGPGGDNC